MNTFLFIFKHEYWATKHYEANDLIPQYFREADFSRKSAYWIFYFT